MGKITAVSFEGENVKVVYATSKGKGIIVNDALTLKEKDFDGFLQKEKIKEFIVAYDFKNPYQEVILIPPVKSRYIKKLAEAEIRKRAPDLKDFSFIYTPLEEKIIGNRKVQELFVFAVRKYEIKDVLDRFINKGKTVKSVYPNVLSLGSLLRTIDEPSLCILECNSYKNLFLVKNGKIHFMRKAQSIEQGITDFDIQNINMTINYCQQSLRIEPSIVMLLGRLSNLYNTTMPTLKPLTSLPQPADIRALREVFQDYIIPISALFKQEETNLLPREYKSLYLIQKAFVYSTVLLLLLSIINAGYINLELSSLTETKNILTTIKSEMPDIEKTLSLYNQKKKELEKYTPLLNFSKNASSAPEIQKLLISLSEINTNNIRINSLTINVNNNVLKTELKGTVTTEGYADMQTHFQNFIDSINDISGINIKNQNFLTLSGKNFVIELDYPVLKEKVK